MAATIWQEMILSKPHSCGYSWSGFSHVNGSYDEVMAAAHKSPYNDDQKENAQVDNNAIEKKKTEKTVRKF